MGTTQPAGERSMLQQIKKGFLKRNEPLLRGWDEQANPNPNPNPKRVSTEEEARPSSSR